MSGRITSSTVPGQPDTGASPRADAITVVHFISCPFSGSTWLNLMLGAHPDVLAVGEVRWVEHNGQATCRAHGNQCPLWGRYDPKSSEDLYEQIARLSGKRLIVDSTKDLPWVTRPRPERVVKKYIVLIRDGRAVTASYLRKKLLPMRKGVRWWLGEARKRQELSRRLPESDQILVHYEALTQDTSAELRRICAFLGIPFHPMMLEYWNGEHHSIAGNEGTFQGMFEKVGHESPTEATGRLNNPQWKWDLDYYRSTDPATFTDERWKKELGLWKRLVFWFHARRLNRQLGYGRHGLAGREVVAPTFRP